LVMVVIVFMSFTPSFSFVSRSCLLLLPLLLPSFLN
jgi:hypothetical protein